MSYHQISRPELGIRREWQFPLPQMRTLDNGMTIWAYQLPGQYVLSMELVFDVALSDEPTGHEGVATLALRCSDEGTVAHPGNALAERIESIGAEYDGGAARWATRCGIDVAAPYADRNCSGGGWGPGLSVEQVDEDLVGVAGLLGGGGQVGAQPEEALG
ncbi:insulinase family protein, partial [Propionibacterium freudenreichii]|nr:insulinase family protein [Propionibacterium freudenreichii]